MVVANQRLVVMVVVSGCEREEEIVGVVVVNWFGYFDFIKIWGCAGFANDILSLFKLGWELCLLSLVWLRDWTGFVCYLAWLRNLIPKMGLFVVGLFCSRFVSCSCVWFSKFVWIYWVCVLVCSWLSGTQVWINVFLVFFFLFFLLLSWKFNFLNYILA